MNIISVPFAVKQQPKISAGEISFVHYSDRGSLFKNRVAFDQHAISFVLNGQKEIYRAANKTVITAGQGMLIPAGNTIIAEHSINDDPYSSFIIFFPAGLANQFMAKHAIGTNQPVNNCEIPPYIHFSNTPYLNEYLNGLRRLVATGQQLSHPLALHKLDELLLVIHELFPNHLSSIFGAGRNAAQLSLKKLVENNLFNNLTLDELAFLANRSRSSFKRDFEKAYSVSPQKYIREYKLQVACAELQKGKQASELYDAWGYDNLSNFNTAFKKMFGLTPAAYRLGKQV